MPTCDRLIIMRYSGNVKVHCFPTYIYNFDVQQLPIYQKQKKFTLNFPMNMQRFFAEWLIALRQAKYPEQFYLNRLRGHVVAETWCNTDCLPKRCWLSAMANEILLSVEFIFGRGGAMLQTPANLDIMLQTFR